MSSMRRSAPSRPVKFRTAQGTPRRPTLAELTATSPEVRSITERSQTPPEDRTDPDALITDVRNIVESAACASDKLTEEAIALLEQQAGKGLLLEEIQAGEKLLNERMQELETSRQLEMAMRCLLEERSGAQKRLDEQSLKLRRMEQALKLVAASISRPSSAGSEFPLLTPSRIPNAPTPRRIDSSSSTNITHSTPSRIPDASEQVDDTPVADVEAPDAPLPTSPSSQPDLSLLEGTPNTPHRMVTRLYYHYMMEHGILPDELSPQIFGNVSLPGQYGESPARSRRKRRKTDLEDRDRDHASGTRDLHDHGKTETSNVPIAGSSASPNCVRPQEDSKDAEENIPAVDNVVQDEPRDLPKTALKGVEQEQDGPGVSEARVRLVNAGLLEANTRLKPDANPSTSGMVTASPAIRTAPDAADTEKP